MLIVSTTKPFTRNHISCSTNTLKLAYSKVEIKIFSRGGPLDPRLKGGAPKAMIRSGCHKLSLRHPRLNVHDLKWIKQKWKIDDIPCVIIMIKWIMQLLHVWVERERDRINWTWFVLFSAIIKRLCDVEMPVFRPENSIENADSEMPKTVELIMQRCWSEKPNDRPEFEQVVKLIKRINKGKWVTISVR